MGTLQSEIGKVRAQGHLADASLHERVVASRRALAQQVVKSGRRVIVLGAMHGNLPPAVMEHPFIEAYQDNYPDRLPDKAGLVLTTRFISHKDLERLKGDAYRREIEFHPTPFTTGDLREILLPLVDPVAQLETLAAETSVPPPIVEESEMPTDQPRGAVKAFVIKHAKLDVDDVQVEGDRLYALPQRARELPKTTSASLAQCIYQLRRAVNIAAPKRPASNGHRVTVKPDPVRVEESDEVLRLAEDALKASRDTQAAIALLMERYKQLRGRLGNVEKLKAQLAEQLAKL